MMSASSISKLSLPTALICLLIGFPIISETIYTPSLPSIAEALSVSAHWVEWTLSIYFMGFALGVGYWGILADKIGRRPVMLIGIVIYCIGTMGCLYAQNIYLLLFWRAIQALGASVGSVITQTMMRDIYSGKQLSRLYSFLAVPLSIAPALGPFLGSCLDYHFDWRANFMALSVLGITILVIAFRTLPETLQHTHQENKALSIIDLAIMMMRDKKVLGCAFLVAGLNCIFFGFFGEAPFILMEIMGLSAIQYSTLGLTMALAGVCGGFVSHRLHRITGSEQIIGIGLVLALIGATGLVVVAYSGLLTSENIFQGTLCYLTMMFVIVLGGMGMAIPNVLSIALSEYRGVSGRSGSVFGLGYYVLLAVLLWLMGALHDGTVYPVQWYFWALTLMMSIIYYLSLWLPALNLEKQSP